jgi:hypothetical protein
LVGAWTPDPSTDYLLCETVQRQLEVFSTFLNWDLGRLDGGTLSSWAVHTAERCGIEL